MTRTIEKEHGARVNSSSSLPFSFIMHTRPIRVGDCCTWCVLRLTSSYNVYIYKRVCVCAYTIATTYTRDPMTTENNQGARIYTYIYAPRYVFLRIPHTENVINFFSPPIYLIPLASTDAIKKSFGPGAY